jgi:glycosyltransferase involved in cell wall biosynthesis
MSKETSKGRVLYLVMDGDFARNQGVPSSNRNHFAIFGGRYTEVFDQVYIMCRVHDVEDDKTLPVGGQGVDVIALPPIHGWRDLLRYGLDIVKAFVRIPRDAVVLLRVPGIYPILAWLILAMRRQPYGVEAMADADAQFTPGAYQKRLRSVYRVIWTRMMKLQCRHAAASSYVTTNALQSQFPPGAGRPSFSYTTLDLPEQALVRRPRSRASFEKQELILINVAMMQKHLKGQDLIIRAVARLVRSGIRPKLWLVGDGDTRGEFEGLAAELGVLENVKFLGRVQAGAEVFALLDQADIFVLPSRQEGLPRVVIEAMARALPCFASALPGNHELLDPQFLVRQDDVQDWVLKLGDTLRRPELLARASQVNLAAARRFTVGKIQPIRNRFYETLSSCSA